MAGNRRTIARRALPLSMLLLTACASQGPYVRSSGSAPAAPAAAAPPAGGVELPRSARGNPPFYDVLGKRYHVLDTSVGYQAQGVASWYGRDFHGLSTSSGEIYDMNAMTAAHTTLPLPTWVEVVNLENGRRTIVKVNDRGPFVANRLIDLSYAAARELDMVRNGTARVEVRSLAGTPLARQGAPAPVSVATAPAAAPPVGAGAGAAAAAGTAAAPAPPPAPRLFVQVGAFGDAANAARLVEQLRTQGFATATAVTERDGNRTLYRVRIGPLVGAAEFDAVRERLRALGVGDSHLVVDR